MKIPSRRPWKWNMGSSYYRKMKQIKFDDVNSLRKFLRIREEETESITTSNEAKNFV